MSCSCLLNALIRTSASRSSILRRAARCLASAVSRGLASADARPDATEALLWERRCDGVFAVGDGTMEFRRRLGWGILLGDGERGEAKEAREANEAVDAARGEGTEGEAA